MKDFVIMASLVCVGAISSLDLSAKENPTPYEMREFERLGVVKAWAKYKSRLSWGKGQCLAILDDGCDLTVPEWQVEMPWGKKVAATYNSIDDNLDPSPVPPGYHGTTVGYPSSLNFEGRRGVAFNNQVAQVRCVTVVHLRQDEAKTMAKALQWVVENREKHQITAVNLSPLDDQEHISSAATEIDEPLRQLREAGVWVSAPCGNNGHTAGISWPASAEYCFAIGATNPADGRPHLDRFSNTDILSPATATSSSNAAMAACAMVLREAIEENQFDWRKEGATLPDAMMAIFQKTGKEVKDEATGLAFREANLLRALDYVYAEGKLLSSARPISENPDRTFTGRQIFDSEEWIPEDFLGRNSREFAQEEGEGLLMRTEEGGENCSYFLPIPDATADHLIEVAARLDLRSGIYRMRLVLGGGEEYLINLYASGEIGAYTANGYDVLKTPEHKVTEVRLVLDPDKRPRMQVYANNGDDALFDFVPSPATAVREAGLTLGDDAGEYFGECLWEMVSIRVPPSFAFNTPHSVSLTANLNKIHQP